MKVYVERDGEQRLVGRADLPSMDEGDYEVPLFGPSSIIMERFSVGSLIHHQPDGQMRVERVVLALAEQAVQILPGWQAMQA